MSAPRPRDRRRGRPRNGPSRQARRDELLDAALAAIRRGGPTTSMSSIAAEAGLTKPVVYAHFGDRAGLVAAIARRTTDDLMARLAEPFAEPRPLEETIRLTVGAFVDFAAREPALFSFLLHPSGSRTPNADVRVLIETVAEPIEALARAPLAAFGVSPVDTSLRVRAVIGLAYTVVDWWLAQGLDALEPDALTDRLTSLVWATFATPG